MKALFLFIGYKQSKENRECQSKNEIRQPLEDIIGLRIVYMQTKNHKIRSTQERSKLGKQQLCVRLGYGTHSISTEFLGHTHTETIPTRRGGGGGYNKTKSTRGVEEKRKLKQITYSYILKV